MKRAGKVEAFFELSDKLLKENTLRPYQKNRLYEVLGNAHWEAGKLDLATVAFQNSLALGVDLESQRAQWVKLDALKRPAEQSDKLMLYLFGRLKKSEATQWL